ncbi:MAG: pyridoxal phosphate-dependent aminotransferase [Myxococcales bacterium]|nr:pyridoxal phosphate-dependent aminotransferase [Myxococcales bacterium]
MSEPRDKPIPVSQRAQRMSPFLVMEVLERAAALSAQGRSIVHLEVGEPDFDTPAVVREAAERAMRDGHTHYTHSLGHPELRAAIAEWLSARHRVSVAPERVVVTVGSSGGMLLAFGALLDPGDEALLSDPHYACYPNFIQAFGGVAVRLPVREEDGFQLDPQAVRARLSPRTRALVINSPANPTGIITGKRRLEELAEAVCGKAAIVSDEVYHGLTYGTEAASILEVCPDAVVVNSFSKLFAMTGWRLGYLVLPPPLVRPVQKLQQNLFISAPDFAQLAAVVALRQAGPDVERMRQCYDERRRLILSRLAEMGLSPLVEPTGAFYVFVNVRRYTDDVYRFAFQLLEEAGVAVTPGTDFGPGGEGFIRISYCNSLANIQEGMDRMQSFLGRHG